MDCVLDNAVARCPFLAKVAAAEGPSFARAIALNPLAPASVTSSVRRPVLEELDTYQHTFRLWHGANGAIPLPGLGSPQPAACPRAAAPSHAAANAVAPCGDAAQPASRGRHTRPLPLATMSLSFGDMPDFGKLLRAFQQQHTQPRRASAQQKPTRQPNIDRAPTAPSSASNSTAGQCPMRKMLGPLAPMVFNPKGHLVCPEVIIKARAALAATKPVRELRPQSLFTKVLAVGATTTAVNVPCGMAREHTEKFSFGWFVAVHASIPFIAMLRKAVIMPKYAILFTIATAIAGQAMGAKLERKRMGTPRIVVAKGACEGSLMAAAVSMPAAQPLSASSRFSMAPKAPAARTVRISKAVTVKHSDSRGTHMPSRGPTSTPHTAIVPHSAVASGALVAVRA